MFQKHQPIPQRIAHHRRLRAHGSLSMNRALMAAGLVDRVQVTLPVITGQSGLDPIFQGADDFDLRRGMIPTMGRSRMAQGVLAERALLTHLGVVDDPLAEGMLAPGMARLVRVARRLPRRTWGRSVTMAGLATRVVWVDRQVAAALEDGICQVALIGAGYDSRTWRFAREGVRFFELDHPVTQQDKRKCAPPGPGPTYVEADLNTHDAGEVLVAGGLEAQRRSLFVVEGVSMYLDEDVVRRQLAGLAKVSAPGSRALVDFMPPRAATTESRWQDRLQRLARIGSGEPFKLLISPDPAADLVGGAGWTVDERASFRSAARSLIGRASGLPVDVVNEHKTLIAASL